MGRLIVVDGLDGSGKTTQLTRLERWLSERGVDFLHISFPDYEKPSSALVREYLNGAYGTEPGDVNAYAASSFYAVDRYASYQTCWAEAYRAERLIVAARYTTSNAIHQMPKLPEREWDGYLDWLADYEYRLLGLPRPDVTVFLDMPPALASRLVSHRYDGTAQQKDIHERNQRYLEQCRAAALYAAARWDWRVIPCSRDGEPRPPEEITSAIAGAITADMAAQPGTAL